MQNSSDIILYWKQVILIVIPYHSRTVVILYHSHTRPPEKRENWLGDLLEPAHPPNIIHSSFGPLNKWWATNRNDGGGLVPTPSRKGDRAQNQSGKKAWRKQATGGFNSD